MDTKKLQMVLLHILHVQGTGNETELKRIAPVFHMLHGFFADQRRFKLRLTLAPGPEKCMLILPYLGAPMEKLHIPAFVMNRLSSGLPEEVGPHLKNMILVGFKYGVTQSRQLISTSEANRSAVRSTVEAVDCPFCSRPENAGFLGKGLGHVCTMKVGCVSDPQLESILEKGS